MNDILNEVLEAVSYINKITKNFQPEIAIILGSGLASSNKNLINELGEDIKDVSIADLITNKIEISYCDIPNFGESSVAGHENKLIFGKIYEKNVVVMQGRFHYYEGYSMSKVALPIKVFAMLGVSKLIVTNAAGGLNKNFKIGDLMLITDHINISGLSPLRGNNINELGERFPSMTNAYSPRLITIAKNASNSKELLDKINFKEGVYAYMPGPQYETKAEIKMLTTLGADAVGMSTVPEVISAVHSGIEVLGISCITNLCFSKESPSHEEVIEVTKSIKDKFNSVVMKIIMDM